MRCLMVAEAHELGGNPKRKVVFLKIGTQSISKYGILMVYDKSISNPIGQVLDRWWISLQFDCILNSYLELGVLLVVYGID